MERKKILALDQARNDALRCVKFRFVSSPLQGKTTLQNAEQKCGSVHKLKFGLRVKSRSPDMDNRTTTMNKTSEKKNLMNTLSLRYLFPMMLIVLAVFMAACDRGGSLFVGSGGGATTPTAVVNQWTWEGGSNTAAAHGVYGTPGKPVSSGPMQAVTAGFARAIM
ncbi:MAG: hypothetical protein ACYDHM_02995 [Acidiferrobacterales bacterium]